MSVEAFVDGLSMSMRETETQTDSKDSGLSDDGIDVNTNEADCGSRKDHRLSFGPMRREMLMKHPREGGEWADGCMSLECR